MALKSPAEGEGEVKVVSLLFLICGVSQTPVATISTYNFMQPDSENGIRALFWAVT